MGNTESIFRLEQAGLMTDSLTDLLGICLRNAKKGKDSEMKSILHIAISVSQGISEDIDKVVEEIIEASK